MLRRGTSLLAVAVAAAAIAAAAPAAAPTQPTFSTIVTIQVTYSTECTFTVTVANDIPIDAASPPGPTIPPGPYQLSIQTPLPDSSFDPSKCAYAMFSLTGPGVSYSTTAGDAFDPGVTANLTLPPSSTYTMVDGNNPSAQLFFTTAATGTSTDLLPPPPAAPPLSSKGTTSTDFIGSGIVPYRGSLTATVPASGKPTLDSGGKPVRRLKAGRYRIVVRDDSRLRGLFVEKAHRKTTEIAGVASTGRRTVTIDFTAGNWIVFSQAGAVTTSFAVTN